MHTDSRPMWRGGPVMVLASWSNPVVHQPTKAKAGNCRQVLWPGSANPQEAEIVGSSTGISSR